MEAARKVLIGLLALFAAVVAVSAPTAAQQQQEKPNIIMIMGDDIGVWNIGAYHHGLMAGRTPNIDQLATEGMLFTDYYAEASCTAGRANFITGELDVKDTVGPRHMVHSFATNVDDATVQPRWGKIGKQKIDDDGELCPKRMETVDDEILANAFKFLDKARADRKPFFLWLNPTRMHVITHLSDKYENLRNSENGWSIQEAGMAQLDDIVGSVMKYLKDNGLDQNTMIAFTTDNGTENFSWPDGGQTPFAGGKGTVMEGGFRAPMILRWPGKSACWQDRERRRVRA